MSDQSNFVSVIKEAISRGFDVSAVVSLMNSNDDIAYDPNWLEI